MLNCLHLGCGTQYMEGFLNVDLYAEKVDMRADLRTLKLPEKQFIKIILCHVLEHVERDEAVDLIQRMLSWLVPGGGLTIDTPDLKKCLRLVEEHWSPPDKDLVLRGLIGFMGGRGDLSETWFDWLWANQDKVRDNMRGGGQVNIPTPEQWKIPGLDHVYVWSADEIIDQLNKAGYGHVYQIKYDNDPLMDSRDSRVIGHRKITS